MLRGAVAGVQPFAYGHAFRQGDVPAGSVAVGDSADWQCTPLTYWPDGSLKHAIIAGRVAVSAGADSSINLSAGASAAGAALTEANLSAALPTTTIAVDGDITTLNSLIGTSALQTTVCTGPVMSSWVYRRPVAGNSHLVVYVEVRLFKGGAVEIFPWIENGYLQVAGPTNFVRTCVVTINGVQRFSQSIDIKHHTRVPLINGSSFSYWVGTDPGITPKHDRNYLLATRLIPNLGWFDPAGSVLDVLPQSYVPNTLADDTNATGSSGGAGNIISNPSALYVTSAGDPRAYRAMMVHGLSSGSWSHHYRDANTHRPFKFSDFPNIRFGYDELSQSNPLVPLGTGGTNAPGNTEPKVSHLPSYAYLPFLVTGRWWFLEESQFWATYAYGGAHRVFRGGAAGIADQGLQPRWRAWHLNVLAQAAAITPPGHPLAAELIASWQANMDRHRRKYVDGSYTAEGNWISPQGYLGDYTGNSDFSTAYRPTNPSTAWWGGAWQHNYIAAVLGYSSEIGIAQSTQSLADHVAVRNHAYKQVIQRADDGLEGRYNWRRFIVFAYPMGANDFGLPLESWWTATQSYAELVAGYGLSSLPATSGLSLKQHSQDGDLSSSDSSRAYGSSGVAALAMAVDHGQAGAREGWNRVSGASNFVSSFSNYLTTEASNFGVLPRAQ